MSLIDDTLEIECLVQALDRYTEAAAEVKKSRDESDNPSWEYFSRHLIDAKNDAASDFGERLNEYIDKRIAGAGPSLCNMRHDGSGQ